MCKKLMFLISLVMVLGLVGSAFGVDRNWTNDYPWSELWISPWNWDPESPYFGPTSADGVWIGAMGPGPIIVDYDDCHAQFIVGPGHLSGSDQYMLIHKDAYLEIHDRGSGDYDESWMVGPEDGITVTIDIVDDAVVNQTGGQRMRFGNGPDSGSAGSGTVIVNVEDRAEVYVDKRWRPADGDGVYVEWNQGDDTYLWVKDRGRLGTDGSATVNLSGNAVASLKQLQTEVRGDLTVPSHTINLDGNAYLETRDGDLELVSSDTGDVTLNMNHADAEVSVSGSLKMQRDAGTAVLNMNDGLITIGDGLNVQDSAGPSGSATINLDDGDIVVGGTFGVPANTGGWAEVQHLGGVIDTTAFAHAGINYWYNICGGTLIINGDVVAAVMSEVDAGRITGCGVEACHTPSMICSRYDVLATYNVPNAGHTTVVADFTSGDKAWCPSPPNGATDVPSIGTILCWCAGEKPGPETPDVHHIFLSTVEADVISGAAYLDSLHISGGTCYDPGPLMLGATYYWKINSQYLAEIVEGSIWHFTVEFCRDVEDFESYNYSGNNIYESWIDGCGYWLGESLISNGTGSCVNLGMANTHSGADAMIYTYENVLDSLWERDHNYSEAWREFDPALDWTSTGEAGLVLWFYGDGDNDSTDMWVKVNDAAKQLYGHNGEDVDDIKVEEWLDWNVELAALATDLSDVTRLSIGFGDDVGNAPDDAMGMVLFDDISLCPTRCVPRLVEIVDLNGDCVTDWLDMKILTDWWLEDRR